MSRKTPRKRTHPKPKAVLRLPDLDQAKSAVLNSLSSLTPSEGIDMPSMNSWNGIARSLGSLSVEPLSSLSDSSRISPPRSGDNQSAPGSRPPLGLRGCGLWPPKP